MDDWEDAHGTHAHVAQGMMLQILREPYAIMRFQSTLLGLFEIFFNILPWYSSFQRIFCESE